MPVKIKKASKSIRGYGWQPDVPDQRDHLYQVTRQVLPASVDLRAHMPSVYDQGSLGSCTANAVAGTIEFLRNAGTPSRLYIYYNTRNAMNTTKVDSGGTIRGAVKAVAKEGAAPEKSWPYLIGKFATRPPKPIFKEGEQHKEVDYQRVPQTMSGIKTALAEGFPIVFGFSVYESFESDQVAADGIMRMPSPSEQMIGGHAVLLVGYTINKGLIVRNSWGPSWGAKGYFYMPWDYALDHDLADDFWTIR